jgi:putative Mg2+ transporter-C (MgtC) family protein
MDGQGREHNVPMPSELDLILRLLLAAALAGVLGLERELTEQPAGFRTHILVGLGAGLFSIISAYGFESVVGVGDGRTVVADPTRVASQIVVGIGFLGGGAILKYGATVRGLTTAGSLWITAAIGTAIGLGLLVIGTAATVIALLALVALRPLRGVVRRYAVGRDEFVIQADPQLDVEGVVTAVREAKATLLEMRITEEGGLRGVHLAVRLPRDTSPTDLVGALSRLEWVRTADWLS